ncbi:MAG TPA: hypothetical protein PLR26_00515 [Bacilli bacterium]|nr:hypothetical protein [Bacilli bacterium]
MQTIIAMLQGLYQTLFVQYPAFIAIILTTTIVLMGFVRMLAFKKVPVLEIVLAILIAGFYYALRVPIVVPAGLVTKARYGVYIFAFLANVATIIHFIITKKAVTATTQTSVDYLKNANVDIYVEVNQRGKIKECNLEFLSIVNLERKDVLGKKLLPLIIDKVDIVTFDGDLFNESVIKALHEKSKNRKKEKNNIQFEIQYRNNEGSLLTYHFFEIPIFVGNRYVGKVLVGEKEKSTLLVRAQTALGQLMADVNTAKQQTFALFTLLNEPAFLFDHSSKKYLLSEKIRRVLNMNESEINFDQYLKMMHPDDIERFVEKSAEVNSRTITKFTYRIKIGSEYMVFEESSILLDDENSQVSLIRLVKVRKEKAPEPVVEQKHEEVVAPVAVETKDSVIVKQKIEPKPQPKPTNEDLLKELKALEDRIFTKK